MKKFKYKKIMKENTVVHCQSKKQAKQLLKWADSKGLRWSSNRSYLEDLNYDMYRGKTCYYLTLGFYCDSHFYKNKNYTILSFEEVIK